MSDEKLARLYERAAALREEGAGECAVSPEVMVEVLEGRLAAADRSKTLLAILSDARGRREFALLRTIVRESPAAVVRGRRIAPWPMAWAAVLLLTISSGVLWRMLPPSDDTVRAGIGARDVQLLSPGSEVPLTEPGVFAWRPARDALRYSVDLVSPDGISIYSAVVTDTVMVLPDSLRLEAGDYRWWVEAAFNDGTLSRSPIRPLRIVNP